MLHLPSVQKQNVEKALEKLHANGNLSVYEPCNCGGQVRHNNGGNYHAETEFQLDEGKWFARFGSTYEDETAEWEESTVEEIENYIREHSDWL